MIGVMWALPPGVGFNGLLLKLDPAKVNSAADRHYRIAVKHPKSGAKHTYRIDVDIRGYVVAVWVEKTYHGKNTDNRQRVPKGGPTYRRVLSRLRAMRNAGEI